MEGLGKFLLVATFFIGCNVKAQQVSGNVIGKWKSINPYNNRMMEVIFLDSDSSYTEIVRNAQNNKVFSRYNAKFKIVNDSTIKWSLKSNSTYSKISFTNIDTMKFVPYKKELKESIPLRYVFTFKRFK